MSGVNYAGSVRAVTTRASDGTEVTIPATYVEDWQYEVESLHTYRGLADWYLLEGGPECRNP